jgi:hypothetical protein
MDGPVICGTLSLPQLTKAPGEIIFTIVVRILIKSLWPVKATGDFF